MSGLMIVANLLNGSAALKAKVPVGKQFVLDVDEKAAPPYLIISAISGSDGVHLAGQDSYPRERIQVDSVHTTSYGCIEICNLVNAALINTIKLSIPALNVTDVDIIEASRPVSLYVDSRDVKILSQDYHVRWRTA